MKKREPTTPDEALALIGKLARVPIREQRLPDRRRAFRFALDRSKGREREAVLLAGEILGLVDECDCPGRHCVHRCVPEGVRCHHCPTVAEP